MNKNTLSAEDYKKYFLNGITYEAYKSNFQDEINVGDSSPYAQYLPQNWSRQSRLDRKLKLRQDLNDLIEQINEPIHWLVITEHWCGDASQINPIINKAAELSNGKIQIRFVYRDQNEALIDAHLTDGKSRSIPILIQLDVNFELINTFGPRPQEAQILVKGLLEKEEAYSIPLHSWYAKDKQQSIQEEIIDLLKAMAFKTLKVS